MVARDHEHVRAGVDGAARELLEEVGRAAWRAVVVATDRALVGVDGRDDEIGIQLGRADGGVDLREVAGIHRVFVREAVGLAIGPAEEMPFAGDVLAVRAVQANTGPLPVPRRVERGTCAVVLTCKALNPGRPGAVAAGGSDSLVGRNVEANDTTATRPCGLSK